MTDKMSSETHRFTEAEKVQGGEGVPTEAMGPETSAYIAKLEQALSTAKADLEKERRAVETLADSTAALLRRAQEAEAERDEAQRKADNMEKIALARECPWCDDGEAAERAEKAEAEAVRLQDQIEAIQELLESACRETGIDPEGLTFPGRLNKIIEKALHPTTDEGGGDG